MFPRVVSSLSRIEVYLRERKLDSHCVCQGRSWERHVTYWFIAAGVWYAVTQAKMGTIPLRRLTSTDLQISNPTSAYGSH